MIKRGTVFFSLLFVSINVNAQLQENQIGSRINSLGNIGVSLVDTWAMYHNQASLAYLEDYEIATYYSNQFGMEETGNSAIVVIIPAKSLTISTGISHFGYRLFQDINTSVGVGKKLGKYFSIGTQINYVQTFIGNGYEGLQGVYSEVSIISKPIKDFSLGLRIVNPLVSSYLNDKKETIPMVYSFGCNYNFHHRLILGTQIDFKPEFKPSLKFGIEFKLVKAINIRSGVDVAKKEFAFGLGYSLKNLNCDLGFVNHQTLGYSPNISLAYEF